MTKPPSCASSTRVSGPLPAGLAQGVDHYENFPVASWLCPAPLRPAVMALYHFARSADDIADEGNASSAERLADLAAYRQALEHCLQSPGAGLGGEPEAASERWRGIFEPLGAAARRHQLPGPLLHDLLSAFEQDVRHTAAGHRYADTDELLRYCQLSANPVGRLLLHLYGIDDAVSLRHSDQICSALQLINFWQDISRDLPRGRVYLPADALARHGLSVQAFLPGGETGAHGPARQALVAELCAQARQLMQQGAPLVWRVPGRAGWELRLVVQGGLAILDAIAALQHRTWQERPTVRRSDLPRLLWRAWRMAR
jgi:squalene synthase HpnC